MFSVYQDREGLEDDLYQEDEGDSAGSDVNSELEFHLYSQLHYSSNAGEMVEEQVDRGEEAEEQDIQQPEVTAASDGEQEPSGKSGPLSPDINTILQRLTKEKSDKQKKAKSNPKSQRSSSFSFEEVIVIDSGPEVISISDGETANEEEGVCASKGQGAQLTSTPAQQGPVNRTRGLGVPVTVVSSSSESDSGESESNSEASDSSDSSDPSCSDGLENWMILGGGNQDGDQSISLNLEGGYVSSADAEEEGEASWSVSDKDKVARIYNKEKGASIAAQRLSNRYYTSKNVQCRNCNKQGHLSKNCSEPKKLLPCFLCGTPGHLVSQCPNKHCNNCGLPGHIFNSCTERAYWHKQCHRCGMKGHFFDACPEIWRQYHVTTKARTPKQQVEDQGRTPAYCYNCSRKGHFGHACTQHRMFNGTYPTTPFINHYDTVDDINRRQHRIKLKVKELKRNGFFPTSAQTAVTPGPLKKKQKISHYKNNQQPHQSSNNHKPSPSHIFFKDSYDFMASTSKLKKNNKFKQESTANVKPWKHKRPVPRDPPAKLILDEAEDFPRGRGSGEVVDVKGKKYRRKPKKLKQLPSVPQKGHRDGRPDRLSWSGGKQPKPEKAKRKRRGRTQRTANKNLEAQMYPTDENLFAIKQRKRSR